MKINRIIKRPTSYQALFSWQAAFLSGAFLLILSLAGCSQNDDNTSDALGNAVNFNAGIYDTAIPSSQTRTTDNGRSWLTTDKVGIFMLTTGGTLPGDIVTSNGTVADNLQYNVTNVNTGALTSADGTPLYYPQSPNVDFIAYYPYGTITSGHTYNISLNGQTDEAAQNACDVLYTKTSNVAKTQTAIYLAFGHVMSKVTLNIILGEGLTSLSGDDITAAVLSGMPQTAELALQDGTLTAGAVGDISALKVATERNYNATFMSLLVPQPTGGTDRKVVITVGGNTYICPIKDTDDFARGKHYEYKLIVQKNGIVVVGAPTITPWTPKDNGSGTVEEIGEGIEKVKITAGTFLMGSSDGSNPDNADGSGLNVTPREPSRWDDETQHWVMLTKDFYMSKYEITNSQYAAFLNANNIKEDGLWNDGEYPSERLISASPDHYDFGLHWESDKWVPVSGYENHPIIYVSWYGAKSYADWVGGTLPTEAQWEYACRGGKVNEPFGIGDGYSLDNKLAIFIWGRSWYWDGISQSANEPFTGIASPQSTQKVGSYPKNVWGLYDMHGNIAEWCLDNYANYPITTTKTDPVIDPGQNGSFPVVRGGDWFSALPQECRSACRNFRFPGILSFTTGFRVVFIP